MSSPDQQQNNYSRQYSEAFGCSHLNRLSYQQKSFCQQCGIFVNNPTTRVYKTLKMKYNTFFDPLRILNITLQSKTMENNTQVVMGQSSSRIQIIEFLEQAAERLRLSNNTVFLSMTYLDQLLSKSQITESQIYLYAATALMVAAKAQELDERIPFISKLKRYASMTNHPEINSYRPDEFKTAERVIIQGMDWKLQQSTLIDRVEALLSFGVVDDDDSLSSPIAQKENKEDLEKSRTSPVTAHQKIRDLQESQVLGYVKEIESKYQELVLGILKEDNLYFQTDQSILALSCIAYLRKKVGFLNIWSQQLQALTGVSAQKISSTVSQIMTVMGKYQNKLYRNLTHHSYLETNSQQINPNTNTNATIINNGINTPTASFPLTSFPYNTQPNRFLFEGSKKSIVDTQINNIRSQTKLSSTTALYTSNSTLTLQKDLKIHDSKVRKNRNNQFTYLNINENSNHPTYLTHFTSFNQELDKKYEQVHKVSATNNSMVRPKIFAGPQ